MQKIDGLRILQFLKNRQKEQNQNDESYLYSNLEHLYGNDFTDKFKQNDLDFNNMPVTNLDALRNFMVEKEDKLLSEAK